MSETFYRFKVGQFQCLLTKDGGGPRVATSFLPDAPPDELETIVRQHNLDPAALDFSINILHIQTDKHSILVDTGLGTSGLPDKLTSEGVDLLTIDTVVITHGHWDHIGGILNVDGEFVYPNAKYIIWKTEWDHWTAADRFAEGDTNPARGVWEKLKANQDRVTTIGGQGAGEAEMFPGICALAAPGHTVGHMALLIESSGEKLLHIADAAHHHFQMACAQWSPSFDADKNQSVVTRQQLFERAALEDARLMGYHFSFPGIGWVNRIDGQLKWQEI
jgi:glyoxylase-like metal-dependent hydrolase (beta-lactamase superfamily II)